MCHVRFLLWGISVKAELTLAVGHLRSAEADFSMNGKKGKKHNFFTQEDLLLEQLPPQEPMTSPSRWFPSAYTPFDLNVVQILMAMQKTLFSAAVSPRLRNRYSTETSYETSANHFSWRLIWGSVTCSAQTWASHSALKIIHVSASATAWSPGKHCCKQSIGICF